MSCIHRERDGQQDKTESLMPGLLSKVTNLRTYIELLMPMPASAAQHDYFNAFCKSRRDIEELISKPLAKANVLIIGCGYRCTDVLLYSQCAQSVRGLDVRDVFFRDGFYELYRSHRAQGKTVGASVFNAYAARAGLPAYYRRIGELSRESGSHAGLKLDTYDGGTIPFEDGQFDAVLSNAVLEHVLDLDTFVAEVSRVTAAGGISYHLYHNYYCFSGCHLPLRRCEEHPWGHLRGKLHTDPKHLNKVRVDDVRAAFSRAFDVRRVFQVGKDHSKKGVDSGFRYESEELLTSELEVELREFSREELLTRCFLVVARKPPNREGSLLVRDVGKGNDLPGK